MYRVLIVDDEPEIGRSLRRVLRGIYEVELASSASEALAKLDVFRADIVISDFSMPGIDGAQLLNEVHRRQPSSIRLLLSGLVELDLKALPIDVGSITRFVRKPWKNDELIEILAALLEERALAAA
jgi:response regulator RpfG family c-di-GMP phosphodiesterase